MPLGVCPQCRGRFVIEAERSYQRTCPRCLCPMELATLDQAETRLPEPAGPPPAGPPLENGGLVYNGAPLATDELGQKVMAVIAEGAYQRECARARREAYRRRERDGSEPGSAGVRWADPVRGSFSRPDQGIRGGAAGADPQQRAAELCHLAEQVCANARDLHHQAQTLRTAARVLREDAGGAIGSETDLPPLDLVLFSESRTLTWLDPEHPPAWLEERLVPPTTVYIWGYGPPQSALCRDQCRPSEAAALFAARAGWDAARPGAWAKETLVLQPMTATLREMDPTIRQDSTVAGWGMRTARAD